MPTPQPSWTIRPVTTRLPDSKELWEDTNLPMCAVVTPGAGVNTTSSNSNSNSNGDGRTTLASLPKCLHCGAPHATRQTHMRPLHEPILFCYLCGKASSTLLQDQQEAREAEVLDSGTYDRFAAETQGDVVVDVPLFPALSGDAPIPRLAAKACPPVWWILLDASQSARSYWTTVGSVLETALSEIPAHVHVGIVAANATHFSTWDLTSDVPHVWHYPLTAPNMQLCLVPADALYKSNILTAIRAIADAQPGTLASVTKGEEGEDGGAALGMALGLTLEVILEFMEAAKHPGDDPDDEIANGNPQDTADEVKLRYAGGKILCLLGNLPLEIAPKLLESQPPYGPGGVGGACSDITQDKWAEFHDKPESEPTDWTPSNLKEYVEPLDPEDLFDTLGTKCANAALGVDLLVVVPEEVEPDNEEFALEIRPFYGLPLLSVLANSSGAPGPLLFGTKDESSVKALQTQLMARTPWQPGMLFGVNVRLRISPGFDLEDSPIEPVGRDKLQLAPYLSTGGLAGPAAMADKGLWVMGSCDAHTSVVVDYQVMQPEMVVTADGIGQVTMKPVLQICVAFTCVEQDSQGDYYTSRKLKISSVSLPFTSDSEPFYDALDPEALAPVLYQKLVLNAVQEGFVAAQETAESWLKSLLVCVYQSAQVEQARLEELMHSEDRARMPAEDLAEEGTQLKASERLLDIRGGDLSEEEVLLGQGHPKIAVMPLIVFSLMQCDALRPTMGSFSPSMDARCAALMQMASMKPSSLSKCVAPSLQLWSTADDKVLLESIDLTQNSIQAALKDHKASDAVFFLDSPQQILVYRADQGLLSSKAASTSSSELILGPRLKASIQVAAKAYRTRPPIRYELQAQPFSKAAAMALKNVLVEDCPTYSGMQDYAEWKSEIANKVKE